MELGQAQGEHRAQLDCLMRVAASQNACEPETGDSWVYYFLLSQMYKIFNHKKQLKIVTQ